MSDLLDMNEWCQCGYRRYDHDAEGNHPTNWAYRNGRHELDVDGKGNHRPGFKRSQGFNDLTRIWSQVGFS